MACCCRPEEARRRRWGGREGLGESCAPRKKLGSARGGLAMHTGGRSRRLHGGGEAMMVERVGERALRARHGTTKVVAHVVGRERARRQGAVVAARSFTWP